MIQMIAGVEVQALKAGDELHDDSIMNSRAFQSLYIVNEIVSIFHIYLTTNDDAYAI